MLAASEPERRHRAVDFVAFLGEIDESVDDLESHPRFGLRELAGETRIPKVFVDGATVDFAL